MKSWIDRLISNVYFVMFSFPPSTHQKNLYFTYWDEFDSQEDLRGSGASVKERKSNTARTSMTLSFSQYTVVSHPKMFKLVRENKCRVHLFCRYYKNTDGVLLFLCAAILLLHNRLVYSYLLFCTSKWMSPLWKDYWTDKRKRVTLLFFFPKTNKYCCWCTHTCSSSACSQTGLTPEKPRASAVTHTSHTHINQPFICFLNSARPACCLSVTLLQTTHMPPVKLRQSVISRYTG